MDEAENLPSEPTQELNGMSSSAIAQDQPKDESEAQDVVVPQTEPEDSAVGDDTAVKVEQEELLTSDLISESRKRKAPGSTMIGVRPSNRFSVGNKRLPQILNECHQLYAETKRNPLQAFPQSGAGIGAYADRLGPGGDKVKHSPEYEVEIAIVRKMREYRRKISKEYGPYAEIDLEEILAPVDRIEALLLKSAKSHSLNNLYLTQLADSSMKMIEEDGDFLRLVSRLASIIQGDDIDYASLSELQLGSQNADTETRELVHGLRQKTHQFVNNNLLFIEKMQNIHDKLGLILDRKKEFLRSLRDRFLTLYTATSSGMTSPTNPR